MRTFYSRILGSLKEKNHWQKGYVAACFGRVYRHPLISGSVIIFIGSTLVNICNFFFNLFMSRNLTVEDYGILASLISLLSLATLPVGAMMTTVINFAASYFAKERFDLARGLFFKITKPSFLVGFSIFIILFIFNQNIGQFFHIPNYDLILLIGFLILICYAGVANGSLLQAKLDFNFIAFSNLLGALSKLLLGIIFVFAGFAIGGAMSAILFAYFISYILSFIPLRFLFDRRITLPKIETGKLFSYGIPAAIANFGLTSLITTDILLVKHFFVPEQAGIYAGLSLVGRVIFFLSAPIGTVMFPLIVQKKTREENYQGIFLLALALVFMASIALTIIYFLFPEYIIRLFVKKEQYLMVSPILGTFGFFIAVYSLLSITTNFYLSIKRTKVFIPIGLGAIIQILLILFFHETFLQIILISLSIVILLLIFLLLYYPHAINDQNKKES